MSCAHSASTSDYIQKGRLQRGRSSFFCSFPDTYNSASSVYYTAIRCKPRVEHTLRESYRRRQRPVAAQSISNQQSCTTGRLVVRIFFEWVPVSARGVRLNISGNRTVFCTPSPMKCCQLPLSHHKLVVCSLCG